MAEQIVFSRAVGFHFPTAIPVKLERVDEFAVGKVFIYHKKPRFLLPWRKHKLDFTGYPLTDLMVQGSNFSYATGRNFLFDIAKGKETVDTKLGMDAELKEALLKLNMKVKGKYSHQTSITTDFGKITHIETDLFKVLSDKTYSLDTANPIVREAIAKGSTVFVISTVYEAERSNISMMLSRSGSETVGGGAEVHGVGGDVDESVAHSDSDVQVTNRNIPTPIAMLLLKLTIGRRGRLTPQLRSGLDHSTEVGLPFDLHWNVPPTEGTDGPHPDHYTHGLKDIQAFTGSTYEDIQTEVKKSLGPLLGKPDLQKAFLEFTKLPPDNLRKLLEYLQQSRDALRTHHAAPPNEDADLNPVLQALSPSEETQLGETTALMLAAEACSDFSDDTLLQGMFALDQEKRTAVLNLVKETPYGTAHHAFEDEGPFKDPVLQPILSKMGYSCPENKLQYSADANADEDMLVAGSIVILIAPPLS